MSFKLLKIIEGCTRYIESENPGEPGFEIDTSQMIFIGTGAFQELHDTKKTAPIGFNVCFNTEIKKEEPKDNKKLKIDTEKLINYGIKSTTIGNVIGIYISRSCISLLVRIENYCQCFTICTQI